jgi:hypothetical protein
MELTHPAVTIFSDLLGPEWRVVDLLVRDDKAALVEMRQGELRRTYILVARRGEWVPPGMLTGTATQLPAQRPALTTPEEAFLQQQQYASGWPSSDGSPPSEVWMTLDGIVAEDVVAVSLTTNSDRFQAGVRDDGTFLVLVRANRGEEPGVLLHLRTGEPVQVWL